MLPRSLLARNALLIAALVISGQIVSLVGFFFLVQLPRAAQLAEVTARYAATLEATLAAMPRSELAHLLVQPEYPVQRLVEPEPSGTPVTGRFRAPILHRFAQALARRIEGRAVRILDDGQPTLWIALRVPDDNLWFRTGISPVLAENLMNWALMSAVGAFIGITGALLIQRRLNRPLAALAAVARQVGAGRPATRLDENAPSELSDVAKSFNRMVRDIAASERDRALMLAGISHDVRTPLTRIRLASELLRGQTEDHLVDRINTNLAHVDRILGQFLAFAVDEAAEVPVYADVNALVRDRIAVVDGATDKVAFEPAELPHLQVRPLAFTRAIDNLLANALAHGFPPVAVSTWQTGRFWSVAVTDRGEGIPAADQDRLRQPFQRAGDGQSGSSGLGLAIVERIARLHGGALAFERPDGGGFTVRLSLPMVLPRV